MAFAIAHSGVSSAIIGPRTIAQRDDLPAGVEVRLSDEILDRLDAIVPPGTDVGALDQSAYAPPALQHANLRRRVACQETTTPAPDAVALSWMQERRTVW